jgi:hypothetical protein
VQISRRRNHLKISSFFNVTAAIAAAMLGFCVAQASRGRAGFRAASHGHQYVRDSVGRAGPVEESESSRQEIRPADD